MANARRSRGRGTAAAFGLLLLLGGLVAAGVMYALSSGRHDDAVEDFARAGVGCTTTLDFSETGTFYVYQETVSDFTVPDGDCTPIAEPGRSFDAQITGPTEVTLLGDDSISYDSGRFVGTSVARFVIDETGLYEISVHGPEAATVAAVGRDPSKQVDEMRRGALAVGIAGVVLGGLLLALAGRRSRKASTPTIPDGPGWGQPRDPADRAWPPSPPTVPQRPVNPHQPDEPARPVPPPPPLPSRTPNPPTSPWAPPTVNTPPADSTPPEPPPQVRVPPPDPTLPDR